MRMRYAACHCGRRNPFSPTYTIFLQDNPYHLHLQNQLCSIIIGICIMKAIQQGSLTWLLIGLRYALTPGFHALA